MLIPPDHVPTRVGVALSLCLLAAIFTSGIMLSQVVALARF